MIVNRETKKVAFKLEIDPGNEMFFGETETDGLVNVDLELVAQKITWNKGDPFSRQTVLETEKKLKSTGLFNYVSISYPLEQPQENELPMKIVVAERLHRSITASIGHSTNEGTEFAFEWQHRNIRGLGERLKFVIDASERKQQSTLSYRKPHYLKDNQDLIISLSSTRETTQGFKAYTTALKGMIERKINKSLDLSFGTTLKQVNSTPSANRDSYTLLGLPYRIQWQEELPIKAYIDFEFTPYINMLNLSHSFLKQSISGSMLYLCPSFKRLSIFGTASFGSISGASHLDVPPPTRFYGGSATFMRGYKYRTVSPLDSNTGKPIGGRSMMYYNLETRLKMTDNAEFTLFYDLGNVFSHSAPQFNKKLLRSWGTGLLYQTPIGPLRFELAFPLDRRQGIDNSSHFYLSVGRKF